MFEATPGPLGIPDCSPEKWEALSDPPTGGTALHLATGVIAKHQKAPESVPPPPRHRGVESEHSGPHDNDNEDAGGF